MAQTTSTRAGVQPRNGLGTAALVTGPIALTMVLSYLMFPLGALVAVAATTLGVFAVLRVNRGAASNRSHALAGLACGGLALALAVVFTVRTGAFLYTHQDTLVNLGNCTSGASGDAAQIDCVRDFLTELEAAE